MPYPWHSLGGLYGLGLLSATTAVYWLFTEPSIRYAEEEAEASGHYERRWADAGGCWVSCAQKGQSENELADWERPTGGNRPQRP